MQPLELATIITILFISFIITSCLLLLLLVLFTLYRYSIISALFLILTEAIIARAGLSDGVYYITDGRKYDAATSSQHLTYSHHTLLPALDQQQSTTL